MSKNNLNQSTPDVGRAIPAGDTKVNPDPTQPPSTGVVVPLDDKTTSIHHEKTPIQRNTSDAADTNKQSNVPSPDVQGNPIPMTIPVFQPIKFSEHPKFDDFIKTLSTNFHGQKISYVYQPFKQSPIRIPKAGTSNVRGEPIKPIMTRSYNYVPVKFPRKQGKFPKHLNIQPLPEFIPRSKIFPKIIPDSMRYLDKIPPLKNYSHKYISMKSSVPIFLRNNPNHENAPASGNKNMDIVNIELPTPDASYFRSPLLISVLAFLILSTIITTLFLLFKYTSFGWLFGKKKKKKSLKRQLKIKKISEEHPHFDNTSNYSIKDIPYEKTTHNDKNIYSKIKMQKAIIKENVTLQKGKKNNRKAIIDIHMELLNEYKNDEWELNKNDFLQICLEEFVREQNKIYSNSENTNLVMKNISIQNTKDKMVLLDKWTERCRPIWEKFKSENAFKVLQNEWKKEEMEYLENIEQFENIILNENTKFSYKEIKKEIWRKCITKQAKFMEQFKQEKWFKSLVKQIEDVSDEYKMGEINDGIFVLNIEKLDNINNNEESYKHDNNPFLIKVLTQIFMMVIEECIKEESPEKTELVLDNIIEKLNKEKHAKIESQNIHQENMNNKEYNETLEKDTHKYKDSFKELMEGWTNKTYIDVNSADDKNKSDKWVEMTDKNFLNPNDDISENPIHYIRE
ncbi:STP1 protein [Plasmodium ovale wallikeri]|uniref:STP1 protein n=1 Tax=Plasmodium ovale wallikeri TaxID=864142 RepID=A0A1A9AS24_PLAOA|nr:STP1 protein [Plasmodium ovale wallikeri]